MKHAGRFSQHHIDMLDLTATGVEFLRRHFPGYTDQEYRAHMGRYGLSGETGLQPIHTLSGGQKSRMVSKSRQVFFGVFCYIDPCAHCPGSLSFLFLPFFRLTRHQRRYVRDNSWLLMSVSCARSPQC